MILKRKKNSSIKIKDEEAIVTPIPDEDEGIVKILKNDEDDMQNEEDNVVLNMIKEKRESLSQNKKELNTLKAKIERDCSEIEALEYIASGEPTMSIMDLLNMIQDFCDNADDYESNEQLLEAIEQNILKSTIESIKR